MTQSRNNFRTIKKMNSIKKEIFLIIKFVHLIYIYLYTCVCVCVCVCMYILIYIIIKRIIKSFPMQVNENTLQNMTHKTDKDRY